jgi:hypothetical protein
VYCTLSCYGFMSIDSGEGDEGRAREKREGLLKLYTDFRLSLSFFQEPSGRGEMGEKIP